MKKIISLVILTVISITLAFSQTAWVSHKADNRISLKFPDEPKEVITGTFAAHDKDSSTYVLTVIDFVAAANIDSTALAPMQDSPDFAAQLKQGMTSTLHGVTLDDFKIGKWKGHTSYTSTGINNNDKSQLYSFMVLVGNKLYSLSVIVPAGRPVAGRDEFFSSLTLTN